MDILGLGAQCPENVVCTSTLDPDSCPKGTFYRDKIKSLSCCPGCIKLKGLGEDCTEDDDCEPGMNCGLGTGQCVEDSSQACIKVKKTVTYWRPSCLPNGKYASKQCKGQKLSGKCFCTDEDGVRIFGENVSQKAENMTCKCSRLVHSLRKQKKGISLHCDDNGNFEELQCENGVCWCSNERTGTPYSVVVPEAMIRTLPCFVEKTFGSQYLRKCDSSEVHANFAFKLLAAHGTLNTLITTRSCNYDGSYARVQSLGSRSYCVYRDGLKLTNLEAGRSTCNCAYDEYVAKLEKKTFRFLCTQNGSYEPHQGWDNKEIDVDADGFIYASRDIPSVL